MFPWKMYLQPASGFSCHPMLACQTLRLLRSSKPVHSALAIHSNLQPSTFSTKPSPYLPGQVSNHKNQKSQHFFPTSPPSQGQQMPPRLASVPPDHRRSSVPPQLRSCSCFQSSAKPKKIGSFLGETNENHWFWILLFNINHIIMNLFIASIIIMMLTPIPLSIYFGMSLSEVPKEQACFIAGLSPFNFASRRDLCQWFCWRVVMIWRTFLLTKEVWTQVIVVPALSTSAFHSKEKSNRMNRMTAVLVALKNMYIKGRPRVLCAT